MPLCPTCDNRPFATKEALLQHVRTSSNPHPFCLACDRRFSSELAYNAHMAAKHPPTFDCLKCGKQYSSQFALDGHYRGHTDHPNCPVCGKGFYDNPALTAHIHETHNDLWCSICNLRFESVTAASEHYAMSSVHPKCVHCGGGFRDEEMLEKHVRSHESNMINGKATPPTCVSASRELETPTLRPTPFTSSTNSLQSPPMSATSSTVFSPPTSTVSQPKDLPPVQPTATHGFVSSPPLGFMGVGAQVTRNGPANSFGGTGFSPLSPKPNIFHKDLRRVAAIDTTMRVDSPDISQMMNAQASPLLNVQAPVFSPVGLPKPGKQIDELWSSRENVQVPRGRQWGLQPPGPVAQTWNAAPAGSATPNTASSQQFIPFSSHRLQVPPPRRRAASDFGDGTTPTPDSLPLAGPNHDNSTAPEPRFGAMRSEYNFNPRLYPGSARHAAQTLSNTLGSQNTVSANRGSVNPPNSTVPHTQAQVPTFNRTNPSFDFSSRQQPPSLLSLPLPFSPPERKNSAVRISPPQLSSEKWQEAERVPGSESLHHTTAIEENHQKSSFPNDMSAFSAVSTPRFTSDVPLHDFGVKPEIGTSPSGNGLLPSPSDFSTDFSTISSVSSSVAQAPSPTPVGTRKREPSRSRSRATSSCRSDISSLNIPTYKITESSQRASPASPEVISPVGLAVLPAISPLGPSPIDLDTSFDIPEARHPLPESLPPSPPATHEPLGKQEQRDFTGRTGGLKSRSASAHGVRQDGGVLLAPANRDTRNNFVEARSEPSPPSSPQSFVTSHQELPEERTSITDKNPAQSRSSSRAASVRSAREETTRETNQQAGLDFTVKSPSPMPLSTPATPKAEEETILSPEVASAASPRPGTNKYQHLVAPSLGVTPNISIASTCASEGAGASGSLSSMPSLHCRACRRETPDDITATMCGHVFCNRCIVDAVIKTSRCPFCSTPTLLYCLFRLDLAT